MRVYNMQKYVRLDREQEETQIREQSNRTARFSRRPSYSAIQRRRSYS